MNFPLGRVAMRHTLGRGKFSVRGSIGRSAMVFSTDHGGQQDSFRILKNTVVGVKRMAKQKKKVNQKSDASFNKAQQGAQVAEKMQAQEKAGDEKRGSRMKAERRTAAAKPSGFPEQQVCRHLACCSRSSHCSLESCS